MLSPLQCRVAGYSFVLALHGFTCYDVLARLAVTTKDPVVADFATLQFRFLTIWTFILQMVYASVGLTCDVRTLNGNEPKTLTGVRETMFTALVWPTSLVVPIMFWPMYLTNPQNVFPIFVDKILSDFNNQVLHTYILFFALWELVFLEKREKRYWRDAVMLSGYSVAYLFVLVGSYVERGEWIYPILDKIYGTIFFPIFFIVYFIVLFSLYHLQWPLTEYLQQAKKKPSRKPAKKLH